MISPNIIKKTKYEFDNTNDFVKLEEYVIFEDDRDNEKYIIFKFRNCLDQWLHAFRFVVSEYNSDNELILNTVVSYKEANIKESSSFVPSAKYKASGDCDFIKVDIEYCLFEKMEYDRRMKKDLKYDYTDYKTENNNAFIEESVNVDKKDKKSKKNNKERNNVSSVGSNQSGYIKPTYYSDDKKKNKKKKINIKNITNKFRSKAVRSFAIVVSIFALGFSVFGAMYTKKNATIFEYSDGFVYEIVNETDCEVVKYKGANSTVVINSSVIINGNEYKITAIQENAFRNSGVESVQIKSSDLKIKKNAFMKCKNLVVISQGTSVQNVSVESFAFSGCEKLANINLKSGVFETNSLATLNSLTTLHMKNASGATKLADLFGESSFEGFALTSVFYYGSVNESFFEGYTGTKKIIN